jgi:hypothetical protein
VQVLPPALELPAELQELIRSVSLPFAILVRLDTPARQSEGEFWRPRKPESRGVTHVVHVGSMAQIARWLKVAR